MIRSDGKTIWVNSEETCVLRISGIKELLLTDDRPAEYSLFGILRKLGDEIQEVINKEMREAK